MPCISCKIVLRVVVRRPCSIQLNMLACCQVLGPEASSALDMQVAQNLLPLGPVNLLNLPTLGSVPLDTNLLGVQVRLSLSEGVGIRVASAPAGVLRAVYHER